MKKKYLNNLLAGAVFAALLLLFMSFSIVKKSVLSETRNPGSFSSINLAMSANIQLIKSNECKLEIDADADDLDKIETTVTNGKLEIKTKNRLDNIRNRVNISVYMPKLEGLLVSGSGKINSADQFGSETLNLSVTGSGHIHIEKNGAQIILSTITGSGSIEINAVEKADQLKLVITGSGSYLSTGMKVSSADISITGSGSAKVDVTDELNTHITGSGNVYYAGNPIINAKSTGSGKTKHL